MKLLRAFSALILLASAMTAFAGEETTVKGEILDMACFMAQGAKGPDHKSCAQRCVQGGQPMGLITESGEVYLLLENHKNPDAYATAKKNAAEIVEVKGTLNDRGGVKAITVEACQKI